MRIIDVDAHLHEPLDWVERTDPELAAQLGPPRPLPRRGRRGIRRFEPRRVATAARSNARRQRGTPCCPGSCNIWR